MRVYKNKFGVLEVHKAPIDPIDTRLNLTDEQESNLRQDSGN